MPCLTPELSGLGILAVAGLLIMQTLRVFALLLQGQVMLVWPHQVMPALVSRPPKRHAQQ